MSEEKECKRIRKDNEAINYNEVEPARNVSKSDGLMAVKKMLEHIKFLESRLKEAEKHLAHEESLYSQKKMECQLQDIENAKLKQRLSHLMDVAGKMAGALEDISKRTRIRTIAYRETFGGSGSVSEHICGPTEEAKIAKLALAEWDGIKKEEKC